MIGEGNREEVFNIKRLNPEEIAPILKSYRKRKAQVQAKDYNITNDSQRFELVRIVLGREMTIKDV
jgi:hypothetical protein